MKAGNSAEKTRKEKLSAQKVKREDRQIENMSRPRKQVKLSQKSQKTSDSIDYHKIPNIPEKKLKIQDMSKDPVQLLAELQKQYSEYGGVKLITPPQWNPPFCFKYGQIGLTTRIQNIHKLKLGKVIFFKDGISSFFLFLLTQPFKEKEETYNVRNFQKMAQQFEKEYKFKTNVTGSKFSDKIQSQYWNIVNGKFDGPQWKLKTTVEYAADLPVNKFGSGFPLFANHKSQDSHFNYFTSLFNLNNIYKSPFSILKIADSKRQFISGVTTPWVYMGMMFSSFCWHVQDLWLNSINYNHKGSTKTWYIIPRKYKQKFDQYVIKKTGRQDLLDRITFMLDPLQIIRNGIPVYKANQNEGQYVCTFFKAYHAGFSHGFNVGQAVNFASPASLSYIQESMKYLAQFKQKKPAVLSYDWLVYENKISHAWQSKQKQSNLIDQEYNRILKLQFDWIKSVVDKYNVKLGTEIAAMSKYDKNSCSRCRNYQYLSSIRCCDCQRNYCQNDFYNCCNGNFQLILREPNNDRKKLILLLNKKKKDI